MPGSGGEVQFCSSLCCSTAVLAAALTFAVVSSPVQRDFVPRKAPAIASSPTDFSGVLAPNNALAAVSAIIAEGELAGPETVSLDKDSGSLIACTDDGYLHRLTVSQDGSKWAREHVSGYASVAHSLARPTVSGAFAHGHSQLMYVGGRPHVCEMHSPDTVIFVDAVKGLVLANLTSKTQTVVSTISDDGIPIQFADDLVVDASSGIVYFSDASQVQPWRVPHQGGGWTSWATSKIDLMFGQATGRLLAWDPSSGSTRTLLSGLWFANGVKLAPEGDAVLIAETFEFRVHKYFIKGPHAGKHYVWAKDLPGTVDGISPAPGGGFFAAIPAFRSAVYCLAVPQTWVRRVLSFLPMHMWPDADPYGLVLKLDEVPATVHLSSDPHVRGQGAESAEESGHASGTTPATVAVITGSLHDPSGIVANHITSITPSAHHGDALFLGSIGGDKVVMVPGAAWKQALQQQAEQ